MTYLPLAKTDDPNMRVLVKDQYNQWLTQHKLLPTPGKIKDYGVDWIEAVKRMQRKIKSSKNELHRLITVTVHRHHALKFTRLCTHADQCSR